MSIILYIILVALNGLLVGALARLALPGKDPMSIPQTILIGIAGSLAGGLIAYYAFDSDDQGWGLLVAFACTVALVFAIRKVRDNAAGSSADGPVT